MQEEEEREKEKRRGEAEAEANLKEEREGPMVDAMGIILTMSQLALYVFVEISVWLECLYVAVCVVWEVGRGERERESRLRVSQIRPLS